MSDPPRGPGWWLASDGNWYPPAESPGRPGWWLASDGKWYPSADPSAAEEPAKVSPAAAGGSPGEEWFSGTDHRPTAAAAASQGHRSSAAASSSSRRPISKSFVVALLVVLLVATPTGILLATHRSGTPGATEQTSTTIAHTPASAGAPTLTTRASTGAPSGDVMTAGVALKAFTATFSTLNGEWRAGEYTEMLGHASPPVVEVLIASTICGCGLWSTSYSSVSISALAGQSYPLGFLAEVHMPRTLAGPLVTLLVFQKASTDAPWIVTDASGYGGTNGTLSAHFSQASEPAAPRTVQQATALLGQLASLFDSARTTGRTPPGNAFHPGLVRPHQEVTEIVDELERDHSSTSSERLRDRTTYTVNDVSPAFVAAKGTIVCGDILGTNVVTTMSGKPLRQPASRSVFGPTLLPGIYSTVTAHSVRNACVVLTYAGDFYLPAIQGNVWREVGTKG